MRCLKKLFLMLCIPISFFSCIKSDDIITVMDEADTPVFDIDAVIVNECESVPYYKFSAKYAGNFNFDDLLSITFSNSFGCIELSKYRLSKYHDVKNKTIGPYIFINSNSTVNLDVTYSFNFRTGYSVSTKQIFPIPGEKTNNSVKYTCNEKISPTAVPYESVKALHRAYVKSFSKDSSSGTMSLSFFAPDERIYNGYIELYDSNKNVIGKSKWFRNPETGEMESFFKNAHLLTDDINDVVLKSSDFEFGQGNSFNNTVFIRVVTVDGRQYLEDSIFNKYNYISYSSYSTSSYQVNAQKSANCTTKTSYTLDYGNGSTWVLSTKIVKKPVNSNPIIAKVGSSIVFSSNTAGSYDIKKLMFSTTGLISEEIVTIIVYEGMKLDMPSNGILQLIEYSEKNNSLVLFYVGSTMSKLCILNLLDSSVRSVEIAQTTHSNNTFKFALDPTEKRIVVINSQAVMYVIDFDSLQYVLYSMPEYPTTVSISGGYVYFIANKNSTVSSYLYSYNLSDKSYSCIAISGFDDYSNLVADPSLSFIYYTSSSTRKLNMCDIRGGSIQTSNIKTYNIIGGTAYDKVFQSTYLNRLYCSNGYYFVCPDYDVSIPGNINAYLYVNTSVETFCDSQLKNNFAIMEHPCYTFYTYDSITSARIKKYDMSTMDNNYVNAQIVFYDIDGVLRGVVSYYNTIYLLTL